jgi:hypothetical protein
VIYFLIAAAAPPALNAGLRIGVTRTGDAGAVLTDEDRANIAADRDDAAWFLKPMMIALQKDPIAFRARTLTIMPRVFFALLPVFAATVWLFYRRRRFPVALVFAVHVHAFAFLAFSIVEAAKFSGSEIVVAIVTVPILIAFTGYALASLRAVFGGRWPITIVKAAGIAMVYGIAAVPAFLIVLIWASLV